MGLHCSVRVHERRSVALMLVLFNRIYKILVIFLGFFKVVESRSVDLTGNLFNQICFQVFRILNYYYADPDPTCLPLDPGTEGRVGPKKVLEPFLMILFF